jgi:NTP pyrophosphatase (non-canonical NTP hydrolase)
MKTEDIPNKPPTPWKPYTNTERALAVLGKSAEETAELNQILARCMIQNLESANPDTGKPNREALEEEIADVIAQIHLLIDEFDLDRAKIMNRVHRKQAYQKSWYSQL